MCVCVRLMIFLHHYTKISQTRSYIHIVIHQHFHQHTSSNIFHLIPSQEGDPWALWSTCCESGGLEDVLRLARSCPSGAAALLMAVLPRLQVNLGDKAALEGRRWGAGGGGDRSEL